MIYIIVLVSLLIASYTDIRTKKIPIWLFPLTAVIVAAIRVYENSFQLMPMLIGGGSLFAFFFVFSILGKGGGGDAIMFGCIGFMFGLVFGLWVAFIAEVLYILFVLGRCIIGRSKTPLTKQYPLAPFAAAAYIGVKLWLLIT